jgi:methylated-DNA-[protein]-cysteine S-methyltransferase
MSNEGDDAGCAFFTTPIGMCGVAWNAVGITAVQLPEGREAATRARLLRRSSAAERSAPGPVARAIERMQRLLAGEPEDLRPVALDMSAVAALPRRVYEAARAVPPGATTTYGEIAARVGMPGGARAVGRALGQNPFPIVVPCHRVVAANGLGGFSARGGASTKRRMLAIEGALAPTLFDPPVPGGPPGARTGGATENGRAGRAMR